MQCTACVCGGSALLGDLLGVSSTLPGGASWGLPSLSLTTEGSWIHLGGEGRQTSHQSTDASTPIW